MELLPLSVPLSPPACARKNGPNVECQIATPLPHGILVAYFLDVETDMEEN